MQYYNKHIDFEETENEQYDLTDEHTTIYTEPYFILTALKQFEINNYVNLIESQGISVKIIATNYSHEDDELSYLDIDENEKWYVENDINQEDEEEILFKLNSSTHKVYKCVIKIRPQENFKKENNLGWLELSAYKNISYCCDDAFYSNEFKGFNTPIKTILTKDLIKLCENIK